MFGCCRRRRAGSATCLGIPPPGYAASVPIRCAHGGPGSARLRHDCWGERHLRRTRAVRAGLRLPRRPGRSHRHPGLVRQRTTTGPVGSVLELAAGPAEHARELARRGLRATALDRSPAMCGYAAARAKAAGVELAWSRRTCATSPSPAPTATRCSSTSPITMLNSACHLFTLDDLVRHLAAVRAQLAAGRPVHRRAGAPGRLLRRGAADQQRVDGRGARPARRGPLGRPGRPDRPADPGHPGAHDDHRDGRRTAPSARSATWCPTASGR